MQFGVLTTRRVVTWILAGLAIVTGLSALVGWVGSGEEAFGWELASIFGTALGTTALAGFTGALAFTTSGDVRATWELAQLTRADQEARERPTIVQHDARYGGSWQDGHLYLTLRNVGLGPALRVVIDVKYEAHPDTPFTTSCVHPAITPGELVKLDIPIKFPAPPTRNVRQDGFRVSGRYFDRAQKNEYPIITSWDGAES